MSLEIAAESMGVVVFEAIMPGAMPNDGQRRRERERKKGVKRGGGGRWRVPQTSGKERKSIRLMSVVSVMEEGNEKGEERRGQREETEEECRGEGSDWRPSFTLGSMLLV